MTAIYLMLPVSLLLAFIFLLAYIWSVRSGQYEDTATPALRPLADDASLRQPTDPTRSPSGHNP